MLCGVAKNRGWRQVEEVLNTYDFSPSGLAGAGLGVLLVCTNPGVGGSGVYKQSVLGSGTTNADGRSVGHS